ncbi:MAG: PSD1 domain-containing protein [Planctomycetia bacterium]|nr:PSD1 domain-containing protein [Planctomycetia bacterium]
MRSILVIGVAFAIAVPSAARADDVAAQVLSLLKEKCFACHGDDPKKIESKLNLKSREGMLKGGESGEPALAPGTPDESRLFLAVTRKDKDLVMPPKENDRLSAEQVELLRRWIAAGAPWPETSRPPASEAWSSKEGVIVKTSGGQSPEWTNRKYQPADIWAYQPIRRPAVPKDTIDVSRVTSAIDAFIQAKLKERGITRLATQADKSALIRRATIDLTGLPPAPEEVEAFVRDDAADAFDRLIDRLLDSPHYGEQQARHWLDVVRYADTSGFSNDFERPNAWRYRDYVVRSFNQDKPFDRFIVEQIAGDELDPSDPEMLIAAGFLRMGPWEHTGMTVAAVTRQQWLDDVTHSVGVTFLGQALRCAQCHDHKFDPVPTRDYYSLQAVFATTHFAEREAPFLDVENTGNFAAARAAVEQRLEQVKSLQAALRKKNEDAIAAFLAERAVKSLDELPLDQRPKTDYLGGTFGLSKSDLSLRKVYQKSTQYLERELNRFEPHALSVYSGADNKYTSVKAVNPLPQRRDGPPTVVHVLTRGSLQSPGEAVTPGVLSAMALAASEDAQSSSPVLPDATDGRRLALARWIASPQNTLAARVIVNRVWQQHFGTGLVATPNNFGKMGARPSHPELLDWLATWFIDEGWSIKKLHRLMMASSTYRQSGTHADIEKLRQVDPKNSLLAYFPPRRLAAEELRDAMLAASGELNRERGGPGVFPEINWEVALQPRHIMGSVAPAYLPSRTPRERNRRTIYAFRLRTLADPLLEVFNRPLSEVSCDRRDETTVTPQVFALFNSPFAHGRALAFAASLQKDEATLEGRIERAFSLVYGRAPSADENAACLAHFERMKEHHARHRPERTELPLSVRRGMIEELTGEMVTWEEELTGMKEYQRDVMPCDVGAETRALAEVCMVLLNSNEFLYVR